MRSSRRGGEQIAIILRPTGTDVVGQVRDMFLPGGRRHLKNDF